MTAGDEARSVRGDGASAVVRYLALVDISGYTSFLADVEQTHGKDFRAGLPAGYPILDELLEGVVDALAPEFDLVKLEGDAVFGAAPAARLDGRGEAILQHLVALYAAFATRRTALRSAGDDTCVACTAVEHLDLKVVIHRGVAVTQRVAGREDLHGPAVIAAHRLLKNSVRDRIGYRPYLLVTAPAANALGLGDRGFQHSESYLDVGSIDARVLDLAELAGVAPAVPRPSGPESASWPKLQIVG
jgi:uncharacterized protein DUF2652